MPIQKLLATGEFTPEQQRAFERAFNETLRKLELVDRNDPLCEIVARKIIEIGLTTGRTNPNQITAMAVKYFQR